MLGLFLLGIFSKQATTFGALVGCAAGFLVPLGMYLYSFTSTALVSFLWYTMIGTSITMGVGWLTSSRSVSPSAPHRSP